MSRLEAFYRAATFFSKLRTTQTTRKIVMGALSFRIGYAKAVLVGLTALDYDHFITEIENCAAGA